MTSEDEDRKASEGQQANAREVVRVLAETLASQRGVEGRAQARNQGGFGFLFIEHIYQQKAMPVYARLT